MRPLLALTPVLAWAVSSLGVALPARAQSVTVPGTLVTLAAPPGFRFASKFRGLENPRTGSTITIAEFPPDRYPELAAAFESPRTAAERFDAGGVRIRRVEQISVDSGQIPVAIGGQETRNKEVATYIALFGGQPDKKAVLVTLSIADSSEIGRSGVESILRSVKLGHIATVDEKLAQLSFKFKAAPPFRTADVLSGGVAILASFEGRDPSGEKPVVLIGRAPTSATPAETAQTAERILRGTAGLADAAITEQGSVPFAGGQGQYIVAVAGQRTIVQFLRVLPGGTYLRLMARGETSAVEDVRPAVKEIADSVELLH